MSTKKKKSARKFYPASYKLKLVKLHDDLGERNNLAASNPEKLTEMKALLDAHVAKLQKNQRPPAYTENPKALDTKGVKTLAEYMNMEDFEVYMEEVINKKK